MSLGRLPSSVAYRFEGFSQCRVCKKGIATEARCTTSELRGWVSHDEDGNKIPDPKELLCEDCIKRRTATKRLLQNAGMRAMFQAGIYQPTPQRK